MGLALTKSDLREKASDVETIRKAWKNWDKMFENEFENDNSFQVQAPSEKRGANNSSNNNASNLQIVFHSKESSDS